jgi:kinesin family protein 2/24
MDDGKSHLPFRASKLTLALRNSFISKGLKSRIVMISCVSPCMTSADHSVNTLRYADRLKDNTHVKKIDDLANINNINTHL